jgi:hypothetical protein
VSDAPSLYPEAFEAQVAPGKGQHGYYKKADGWVVVASTTPSNRRDYEYKGFVYLHQYGEFTNGSAQPRAASRERDARGNPWNPALEPWRLIFQRGGAKEFPIDQIIEYRWHIRPPYKEVTFPQLAGLEITNYGCPECDKGVFASLNPREAAIQLRTHLTSGVNGSHSYTPTDLRSLGQEWDIDFESARSGRRVVTFDGKEEEEEEETVDLTPVKDYTCGACGYEPTGKAPWLALRNHKCIGRDAAQEGTSDAANIPATVSI